MISVALIPESKEQLESSLEKLSFASRVQIDVVDGKFAPFLSLPYGPEGDVMEVAQSLKGRHIEVDLMVNNQIEAAERWFSAGASGAVFHLEGLADMTPQLETYKNEGYEIGLAISNDTPLDQLYPHLDSVDFVQLMGIVEIGAQGQPFDPRILERLVMLRSLYPTLSISVDGGVNEETILNLQKAGADRFVVGSAILRAENPEEKYQELLKIITD